MEASTHTAKEPTTEWTGISARSERQAMDWSLVLVSQGIEVAIEPASNSIPWRLMVPKGEYARANSLIRQYRLENRHWAWHRALPATDLTYHVGAWIWMMAMVGIYSVWPGANAAAAFQSDRFLAGEWWRAFSAVGLHGDLAHLASNAVAGVVVLGLAMGRLGPFAALLFAWLAGAAGNLLGAYLHTKPYIGVGASGMITGGIGLLAADAISLWRLSRHATRWVVSSMLGALFLFLTLGSDPKSDLIAHAGGFLAGAILGLPVVWWKWTTNQALMKWMFFALLALVMASLWRGSL